MSHYLPLSRVSKLTGVSRHELQEMIRSGTLKTFDGMIELNELLRAFPETRWEDDGEYRRVTEIKERAFGKRVFERSLPDKEVLAARLFELGNEYAASKALLMHYSNVLSWLDEKIDEIEEDQSEETRHALHTVRAFIVRHLAEVPPDAEKVQTLIARERILKIMSAHVTIQPSGHEFIIEGNDTLLEGALRAGISLNYGCSNGNCGECRARLVSGEVKKVHAHDFVLTQAEKDAGVILMCSCSAVNDVVIEAGVAGASDIHEQHMICKVKSIEVLNPELSVLHLMAPRSQRLRFLAGQSIRLSAQGKTELFPIASCPCEERHIEIQVSKKSGNSFSEVLASGLKANDIVEVDGPYGKFVLEDESRRPVIFLAFGVGFAPIKSLIQHAMSLDVAETIDLHWMADETGHYQHNLCRAWADALDNFHYTHHDKNSSVEAVMNKIVSGYTGVQRFDVYASGSVEQLQTASRIFKEHGLPDQQWHSGAIETN